MYGSPTTKELKKKHSSRLVGGAEMGSWAESTRGKAGGMGQARWWLADSVRWQTADWVVPHLRADKLGSEIDGTTQGSSTGKLSLKAPD